MTIYDNDLLCWTLENYGFSTCPDCYHTLMHMYYCLKEIQWSFGIDFKIMLKRDNQVKHIVGSFGISDAFSIRNLLCLALIPTHLACWSTNFTKLFPFSSSPKLLLVTEYSTIDHINFSKQGREFHSELKKNIFGKLQTCWLLEKNFRY